MIWMFIASSLLLPQNKDQRQKVIVVKTIAAFYHINRNLVSRFIEAIILLYSAVIWQ